MTIAFSHLKKADRKNLERLARYMGLSRGVQGWQKWRLVSVIDLLVNDCSPGMYGRR